MTAKLMAAVSSSRTRKLTLARSAGRARIIVGPSGFVLLAPLPEGRWLIFVNRDEDDQGANPPSAADLAALLNTRIGTERRTFRFALDFVLPDAQARCPVSQRRQALSVGRRGTSFQPDGRGGDQFGAHGRREYRVETGACPSRRRQAFAARHLRDRTRPRRPSRAGGLERDPRPCHATRRKMPGRGDADFAGAGSGRGARGLAQALDARRILQG